ncbi:MAG: universal stress protein [Thaumarchaeota archaeon]|nr:universal stress protein [Nitrososphaerota archaeon]
MSITLPKKILIGVDGSDASLKATAYAIKLAKLGQAGVVALHVILLPAYTSQKTVDSLRKELSARAEEVWERIKKLPDSGDVKFEAKVIETNRSVVQAIVDFALKSDVELIVLGTRGFAGVAKLMLGSVAAGVVNSAHCPVLVVR